MKLITLYISAPYLEALDRLISNRFYPNRSEAIRLAIRDLVQGEMPVVIAQPMEFALSKAKTLWKDNKLCPVCSSQVDPNIRSCETGFNYCSKPCATQHVKALTPPGGW